MKRLRIAIIAPPWLKLPVEGYGGLEAVLDSLVRELVKLDVDVEIFGVGRRKFHGVKVHPVTKTEQFEHILKPMYDFSLPIPTAHMLNALKLIQEDGTFDVIHDHNYFIGPAILSYAAGSGKIPPAVHTLHGPPLTTDRMVEDGVPDNRIFWRSMAGKHQCFIVPISDAMRDTMPAELAGNLLDTVHNALEITDFPYINKEGKKNYFITLARFCEEKGQHVAARICARNNYRLRMAGTVAAISSTRKLLLELANPVSRYRNDRDFRYYSEQVLPYVLRNPRVTYAGNINGRRKMKFISEAKALLFPIAWEEPFGMSVIEALACGTPVVAMNHGAMPELIEHGVTGFLADTEEEFAEYMKRVDEIDPAACRKSVEAKFSGRLMAERYVERYYTAIKRAGRQ
ncbi:MAG TPA: glycosyltransferase family 4 protein [Candidatus Saccharimonadales bacterium]|nr:glycosyltransferase family 4 protein [Candidatus Saccharimonadales bacterium]